MASAIVGVLKVILSADTAEFDTAMKRASSAASSWSKDLGSIGRQATQVGSALTKTLTLPIVGFGVVAVKAASDFESSFAGVRKTVDATEPEFAALAQGIRDMAKEIPVSVDELNKVAESAGQLGIKKEDILQFTRVMADLGVSTTMTADEAATATAQFQNIFGTAGKDVDRFGATLSALGNAGASTEKNIMDMGVRIAGAGHLVGMAQSDVLAMANALSSVGINAEAGGSSISRTILKINDAVSNGGAKLAEFARVAGMSSKDFKQAWGTDAAAATVAFINGIQRLKTEGENVNGTLEGLLGKNILIKTTLLNAAGAGNLLNESLALGRKAWEDNTALTIEANKRYQTFESQLKTLMNQVHDVAITFGTALLPILKDVVHAASAMVPMIDSLAKAFSGLPEWVKLSILGLAGLVAAAGPVIWTFGQITSAVATVIGAFTAKGIATRALTGLMGTATATSGVLATALSYLGGAAAVAATAFVAWNFGRWIGEATGLTDAIGRISAHLLEMIGLLPKGATEQYKAMMAAQKAAEAAKEHATQIAASNKASDEVKDAAAAAAAALGAQAGAANKSAEELKEADKQAKEFAKSLKALGGADALAGAKEVVKQLAALDGPMNVLPSKLKGMADQLLAGAEAARTMGNTKLADDYTKLAKTLDPLVMFQQKYNVTVGEYSTDVTRAADGTAELWEQLARLTGEVITIGPVLKSSLDLSKFFVPLKETIKQNTPDSKAWEQAWDQMHVGLQATLAQVPMTLFRAFEGGGDIWGAIKSIASQIGSSVGRALGEGLSGGSKMMGDLGAAIGSLIGPVLEGFKRLFGIGVSAEVKKANAEIEKLKAGLIETYGTMEDLEAQAQRFGISFKNIWNASGPRGLDQLKAAAEFLEKTLKAVEAASQQTITGFGQVVTFMTMGYSDIAKRVDEARAKVAELNDRANRNELHAALQAQTAAALAAKQSLADLGTQALATFAAALAAGKTYDQAIQAVGPSLATLAQAYKDLGLDVEDVGLKHLLLQATVAQANPQLIAAVGGLASSMQGLAQLGLLNVDSFGAMQRTGLEMYTRLQAAAVANGGSTRDALLPMQAYLHEAAEQAKLLGIPLDDNTQMLIDQSKELGIWKDKGKSAQDLLIAGMEALGKTVRDLIDAIVGVSGAIAAVPNSKTITFEANYVDNGPPPGFGDGGRGDGRGDSGFAVGTLGRLGKYWGNFGAGGFNTTLHNLEAVITPDQAPGFAFETLGAMGFGAGGAASVDTMGIERRLESLERLLGRFPDMVGTAVSDGMQLAGRRRN